MVAIYAKIDEDLKTMSEVEKAYREFWKPILGFSGLLNFSQVKKELYDYCNLIDMVPKVYMHVTNGYISKPNTLPYEVISLHDENINENYIYKPDIEELIKSFEDGKLVDVINELKSLLN